MSFSLSPLEESEIQREVRRRKLEIKDLKDKNQTNYISKCFLGWLSASIFMIFIIGLLAFGVKAKIYYFSCFIFVILSMCFVLWSVAKWKKKHNELNKLFDEYWEKIGGQKDSVLKNI